MTGVAQGNPVKLVMVTVHILTERKSIEEVIAPPLDLTTREAQRKSTND
jgi:hypothetical protein